MVEFWIPKVGDLIKRKDSDVQGKIVSYKAFENNAVAYVCGSTGCHHLSINVHEWQLDNSSCTSPEPLSLTSVEEITKPERYNKKGKLECWDVILDQEMDFLEGSVLKYLWRYKEKNKVHDLEKAKVYIDKIIEGLKK
jgi:hypothetical protein